MVKTFLASKLGRSCVAALVSALAPALPALVMGDLNTARVALASALSAACGVIALNLKNEGDK